MINNLKDISDGNAHFIENEQTVADRKLEIEIWDRDIYQKKRVAMDKMVEIQAMFDLIEASKELLEKRKIKVEDLHHELE
jgi:predicted HTH domain antitoxin